jgi:hypothetical protein
MESVLPIIAGGVVSVVSTAVGALVQHYIWVRKLRYSRKANMSASLYRNQMAFFKRLPAVLEEINGYATTAEVLFIQDEAEKAAAHLRKHNADFSALYHLVTKHKLLLPVDLTEGGEALVLQCLALMQNPSQEAAKACVTSLFAYQNLVREHLGVEPLTNDHRQTLQAEAPGREKAPKKG